MVDLNLLWNVIFLLLTLLAEILGTVGGYGSSVYFVPIGNFFFDFHTVLGLTAVFHLSSNVSKIWLFRQGLNKKLLIHLGIPAIIFVVLGAFLAKYLSETYLELILGIFLVFTSALFLIKRKLEVSPNRKNSIIGGVLSGFSAGVLGTGGAIRGLTMAAFNLEKSIFVSTSAVIDFLVDFSRTIVYITNGFIGKLALFYLPFLFVIGFVGTYLGKRILKKIPQDRFRWFSLVTILLVGIITLFHSIIG